MIDFNWFFTICVRRTYIDYRKIAANNNILYLIWLVLNGHCEVELMTVKCRFNNK